MKADKLISSIIAVVLLISLSLTACGEKKIEYEEQVRVGVSYYDVSDTFLGALIHCLKNDLNQMEQEDLKISVTVRTAESSQRLQDQQVKELIDAGCNVLCVNLVDRSNPSEIIDTARAQDIPIIFFNREPVAEDMRQWEKLYYVGADAEQSGVLQGELAADVISDGYVDKNHDGVIQYVVLEGEAGHQDAIVRTENSVETLKNKGIHLEKLSYQIANWNRAQAQNRMEQLIGQYKSDIELVLANNDDMALGAVDAYKKLNYSVGNWPVVFGVDGTEVGLKAMLDSELAGTVYNDKEGQADALARLSVACVTGEGMEKLKFENDRYIYLPYTKITEENLREYLK